MSSNGFAPAKGTPPSIEFIELPRLNIDDTYQRSIQGRESQSIIRAIAGAWDWRLCPPLMVSRRLPFGAQGAAMLFVIDGQHRLEAARARGDIPFLPCIITTFAGAEEEAGLFVAVNQRRRRVTSLETFRAAVVAGEPLAIEAAELIDAAGLKIARTGSPSGWEPGEIGQMKTVTKGLRRFGQEAVAASLVHLNEAFPDERLEHAGRILDGLFRIHGEPPQDFDADRLFQALLLREQAQWSAAAMTEIARSGETWGPAMRAAMLELYETIPPSASCDVVPPCSRQDAAQLVAGA